MPMSPRLLRPLATGFNPRQIAGLLAWYDAQDAATLTIDTGVSAWADKSGNGYNLSQVTGSSQPISGTRTIGGKNALDFDGSNDVLALGGYSLDLAATKAMTLFVVTASDEPDAIRRLVSLQRTGKNANDTGGYFGRHTSGTASVEVSIGGGDSTSSDQLDRNLARRVSQNTTAASVYAMSASAADDALTLHIDGVGQTLTTRYGTMPASDFLAYGTGDHTLDIGASRGVSNNLAAYWDGVLGEVLLYNRALTTAERQKAEGYLAWRWGLQAQLPSNHPYAYSFPGFGSQARPDNGDALAWESEVYSNSGSVSVGTLAAVNTFANAIDAAGIRDRFFRLSLMAGSNLNAALVPLYRGPSLTGTQYGNATDTNNGPFVSGDYAETSGLYPGATNTSKYLNTGFPANTISAGSAHLGLGILAANTLTSFRTGIGAYNGAANALEIGVRSNNSTQLAAYFSRFGTATDTFGDNIGTTGSSLAAGNIVAAWPTMYRDGVATGTDATTSQDYPSAHNFYVFANNNSGTSVINYSNPRLGWYSIGETMTSGEVEDFNDALVALYSSLGRS